MRLKLLAAGVAVLVIGLVLGGVTTLVVAGSGCTPNCPKIGNLVGYITNVSSTQGIVGASVKLLTNGGVAYAATTTTNGYYQFGAINAGGYAINVTNPGYRPFQGSTGVSTGTTATFSVQLAPVVGTVGTSGGSGCTPTPTGSGCSVPPPPAGVQPPPPLTGSTNTGTATSTKGNLTATVTCASAGGTVRCVTAASGAAPPYKYTYNFGDGSLPLAGSPYGNHSYVFNGNYTVFVAVAATGANVSAAVSMSVSGFGPVALLVSTLGAFIFVLGIAVPKKLPRGGGGVP